MGAGEVGAGGRRGLLLLQPLLHQPLLLQLPDSRQAPLTPFTMALFLPVRNNQYVLLMSRSRCQVGPAAQPVFIWRFRRAFCLASSGPALALAH